MNLKLTLEKAINDYKKITGLRSYLIFSKEDLNSAAERNYFCKCLKISSKAMAQCENCAVDAFDNILNTKKEYIYSCHAGVIKFAIPVLIQDEVKAIIVAEGILNKKQLEESDKWVKYLSEQYDVAAATIKNTFEVITVFNEKELKASVRLLKDLVDYHLNIGE